MKSPLALFSRSGVVNATLFAMQTSSTLNLEARTGYERNVSRVGIVLSVLAVQVASNLSVPVAESCIKSNSLTVKESPLKRQLAGIVVKSGVLGGLVGTQGMNYPML